MSTSTCIAYLNGGYLPLSKVHISPLDRGFLFADSVYEVIPVYNGQLFRLIQHLQRLDNSLKTICLDSGLDQKDWAALLNELVERNGGGDLAIYLQVTRGAPAIRDHGFSPTEIQPTVFAMANSLNPLPDEVHRQGIRAVTCSDIRWGACHIKSTALLANVLARRQAMDQDAADAILVRDGYLTEGTAANLFLVNDDVLMTPPKSPHILPGITRDLILELAVAHGVPHEETDLSAEALETASEVWLTSSTKEIVPVTVVDGRRIGAGVPGPVWGNMMELVQSYKDEVCPMGSGR